MTSQRAVNENDTFRKDNVSSKIDIYQAIDRNVNKNDTNAKDNLTDGLFPEQ